MKINPSHRFIHSLSNTISSLDISLIQNKRRIMELDCILQCFSNLTTLRCMEFNAQNSGSMLIGYSGSWGPHIKHEKNWYNSFQTMVKPTPIPTLISLGWHFQKSISFTKSRVYHHKPLHRWDLLFKHNYFMFVTWMHAVVL